MRVIKGRKKQMSEKATKTPQIRFDGYTDAWEQRKLKDYTKLITKGTTPKDKTGSGKVNFVKVENLSDGKILPIQKITEEEHEGYLKRSRLEEGDILFSIAGTLGRTAIVNKLILPANTNQALAIIRSYDFDKYFLVTTLTGHVVAEYIRKNPTVGAQPNLSLEQVGKLIINTPIKGEQQKIGTFFKQLDDLIALHQRECDLLAKMKKSYLQKMFPKNGEDKPEIRFDGYTDAWEQRKLKDYTKLITKGTTPKDKTGSGKVNFVKVENLSDGKILPIQKITEEEHEGYLKRSRLEEGDILFSIAGTLGRTAIVNKLILPANTNQALAIIRSYDFDKYFLVTTLTGHVVAEYIRKNPTVGAQPNLSLEQVGKLIINTPIKGEQQKIGTFFKQLDDLIALHQRELDSLKKMKKSLLQMMFV